MTMTICHLATYGRTIEGVVVDKLTKEPLIGVAIMIEGTTQGTTTDFDGRFSINAGRQAALNFSYLSYKSIRLHDLENNVLENGLLNIEMESDNIMLDEAVVVGRKVLTSMVALNNERLNSGVAVENIGAKEMSTKGLSDAKEGVERITSVAFNGGQLFVRGLGDRYSATTLNSLPIASPNPDNKIIPLDLFPSSTIENITVQKVYQASAYADYSGAHINIDTRENVGRNFLKISLATGGHLGTLGQDFYSGDTHSLWGGGRIGQEVIDMNSSEFQAYTRANDLFGTTFATRQSVGLPSGSLSVSGGRTMEVGQDELNLIAAANMSNGYASEHESYTSTINNEGGTLSEFDYDSYSQMLELTAMMGMGYHFAQNQQLNLSAFYTRSATDNYKLRKGVDEENNQLVGSNSVLHAYSLLNLQLTGKHTLSDAWDMDWGASYSATDSDEPDRKQVMFEQGEQGELSLFRLNAQETMRYFGDLGENEATAHAKASYAINEQYDLRFGAAYRNKQRSYESARFYYDLDKLGNPNIGNPYETDVYLNHANVANGTINIIKDSQPRYNYYAGGSIAAAFGEIDLNFSSKWLLNIGLRYEYSQQWVQYWNDASQENVRHLNKGDLFPAINTKYSISDKQALRLALSRTVTRPSFVEMAPFYYKESYGSATIRGNEELMNGYNYNADLRYEVLSGNSKDLLSVTAYFKLLDSPIEKIQQLRGNSVEHSFRNINQGMAAGVEVELRKEVVRDLVLGVNGSYMYTNVNLGDEAAIYTDQSRGLQGASPYLVNADVTYQPTFGNDSQLALSLVYNFEGPRIEAVGILGMSNVIEKQDHQLNFVASYAVNGHWNVSAQVENILNTEKVFTQTVGNRDIVVQRYTEGISFEVGASYQF